MKGFTRNGVVIGRRDLRKLLEHVSPNTHGARHVSGCLLSEAGLRNVQHAVYVGVEHWRQLHSWPCDRNRNEGNIRSSQQQCRTVRHGFVFVCVCAREVTKRRIYQDCHHGVLLGDGQDEVSKQSVSWFGQLSIRSRTPRYCVLCEPEKKLGDRTFFHARRWFAC